MPQRHVITWHPPLDSRFNCRRSQYTAYSCPAPSHHTPFARHLSRFLPAPCSYVSDTLGPHFTEPPPASLAELFADSSPAAPLVFITAPGADPGPAIQRLAAAQGRAHRLHAVSLGQGQGPRAEALLHAAVRSGDWLLLHNCHLAASWMPRLERLVEDLQVGRAPGELGVQRGSQTVALPCVLLSVGSGQRRWEWLREGRAFRLGR